MKRWFALLWSSTRSQEREILRQLLRHATTGRQLVEQSGGILRRWSVYLRLESMERRGLVEASRGQGRPTLYSITAQGCEEAPGDYMPRQVRALECQGYQVTATYKRQGVLTGATLERRRSDRPEYIEVAELESMARPALKQGGEA